MLTLLVVPLHGLGPGLAASPACRKLWLVAGLGLCETSRRFAGWFARAEHTMQGHELTQTGPFLAVASLVWAWYAAGTWLGTAVPPALAADGTVPLLLTFALWAGAAYACTRDAGLPAAAVALVALAVPVSGVTPAWASAWAVTGRVLAAWTLHFAVDVRTDGRLTPARWHDVTAHDVRTATGAVADRMAQRVAHVGWVLCATPGFMVLVGGVGLLAYHEYIARTPPVERAPSSPVPSPRRPDIVREPSPPVPEDAPQYFGRFRAKPDAAQFTIDL